MLYYVQHGLQLAENKGAVLWHYGPVVAVDITATPYATVQQQLPVTAQYTITKKKKKKECWVSQY